MDLRIIFLATYEMILSVVFGLLTIFLVNKIFNWTLLKSDSENSLAKGNISMGIFAGTLVVCNLMLVQPSILPSINTLQTMLTGRASMDLSLILISFGFFLFFYLVTTVLSICVLFAATWLYLKATVNIDEIKNFQGLSFLFIFLVLLIWIYSTHINKTSSRDLREILYVFAFLCAFTSLGSFLGMINND